MRLYYQILGDILTISIERSVVSVRVLYDEDIYFHPDLTRYSNQTCIRMQIEQTLPYKVRMH